MGLSGSWVEGEIGADRYEALLERIDSKNGNSTMNNHVLYPDYPTRGFGHFEQQVLKRWKSMQHLFTFIHREMKRLNDAFFEGKLILPQVQIKPMRLARRPLEDFSSSAYYAPAFEDRPAEIGLFPNVLLDPQEARIALAHEMVHHWEWSLPEERADSREEAPEVKEALHRFFKNKAIERSWRRHHSERFLSKAWEMAKQFKVPLREFLFKR